MTKSQLGDIGSSSLLSKLKQKREFHANAVKELDEAIVEALSLLSRIDKYGIFDVDSGQKELELGGIYASNPMHASSHNNPLDFSSLSALEGGIHILKEKGKPLRIKDIVDELIKRGKVFESNDPVSSTSPAFYKESKKPNSRLKSANGMWSLTSY